MAKTKSIDIAIVKAEEAMTELLDTVEQFNACLGNNYTRKQARLRVLRDSREYARAMKRLTQLRGEK